MKPQTLALTPQPKPKSKPQLQSLPIDLPGQDTLPISVLINPYEVNASVPLPRDQILFCYQALLNTIDSLLAKRYTDFDGLTTSHCCHGIAVLGWGLIQMTLDLDVYQLKQRFERAIYYLEQHLEPKTPLPYTDYIPKALANLACLYILQLIKEPDFQKNNRVVTTPYKLKILSPISGRCCVRICQLLQKILCHLDSN